jgi:hypothetical protein
MTNISTDQIARGSVVSCYFPLSEAPDQPGSVARPGLVLRVFLDKNDDKMKAIVAYGTSRETRANSGFELRIGTPDGLKTAGLHQPTRFTLSRMRILPITKKFFAYSASDTPVLGVLDDGLILHLEKTCDKLANISPELRVIVGKNQRDTNQIQQRDIDAEAIDTFFQKSCTGRADLNGRAKQTTKSSEPLVVIKKSRSRGYLRRAR